MTDPVARDTPVHTTTDGREFVRTPDGYFEDLPGFPYAPNYLSKSMDCACTTWTKAHEMARWSCSSTANRTGRISTAR